MGVARVSVVAAVDCSEISGAVVATGGRFAARFGGSCAVLHVIEALSGEEDAGSLLPVLRRWVETARQQAREAVVALTAAQGGAEAGLVAEVIEGRAFERVAEFAREREARLIVVGGSHPHVTLGSTAERVVRRSAVPVLVVRLAPAGGYRNVLVGVDFSQGAAQAVADALSLAEPDARFTLCHVLDTFGLPRFEELSEAAGGLQERLQAWAAERLPGRSVDLRVHLGRPRSALASVAQETGADLLAVGPRGRGGIGRLLLGSVAEAAARRSPCDVLVAASLVPGGEPGGP